MSVRATLRGVHEGLTEPRVTEAGADDAILRTLGDGRAGLVVEAEGPRAEPHAVLLTALDPAPSGGPRRLEVVIDGWRFEVDVEHEARATLREKARRDRGIAGHSGPAEVRAIIPGVVVSVAVAAGDMVESGQQLLVIEAMKMQNELRAPRAGRIERLTVAERSTIEVGDLLVVIE